MEYRVLGREKRLKELKKRAGDNDSSSTGEPDSGGTKIKMRNHVAILGISRMSFEEYKTKPQELEIFKASSCKEQHVGNAYGYTTSTPSY